MNDDLFIIKDTLSDTHREQLLAHFKQQFWLKDRTLEDIQSMERTCLILALIEKETDNLVGFTRVLTDDVKYAYIHDVLVQDDFQGKGLGRYLIEAALSHPSLKHIVCFELLCLPDKVPFYSKFNFKEHDVMKFLRFDKRKL